MKLLKEWVSKKHFVYHDKARKTLNRLDMILERVLLSENDPSQTDRVGLSVSGPSGTGK